jgi:hypothetical protein
MQGHPFLCPLCVLRCGLCSRSDPFFLFLIHLFVGLIQLVIGPFLLMTSLVPPRGIHLVPDNLANSVSHFNYSGTDPDPGLIRIQTLGTGARSISRSGSRSQSREYYRVLIEPPLLFMCTVQGWDVANTLERMRLPA